MKKIITLLFVMIVFISVQFSFGQKSDQALKEIKESYRPFSLFVANLITNDLDYLDICMRPDCENLMKTKYETFNLEASKIRELMATVSQAKSMKDFYDKSLVIYDKLLLSEESKIQYYFFMKKEIEYTIYILKSDQTSEAKQLLKTADELLERYIHLIDHHKNIKDIVLETKKEVMNL